jgi:putative ABC transport system permease protein
MQHSPQSSALAVVAVEVVWVSFAHDRSPDQARVLPEPGRWSDTPRGSGGVVGHRPLVWRLAWRQLSRDFRAGELVPAGGGGDARGGGVLTAVGFFADRINGGLARAMPGRCSAATRSFDDQPAPATFEAKARVLGLVMSTAAFPSTGARHRSAGRPSRLVSVKAGERRLPAAGPVTVAVRRARLMRRGAGGPERAVRCVDPPVPRLAGLAGDTCCSATPACVSRRPHRHRTDRGTGFGRVSPRA